MPLLVHVYDIVDHPFPFVPISLGSANRAPADIWDLSGPGRIGLCSSTPVGAIKLLYLARVLAFYLRMS